eukprot:gene10782-13203_t
MIIVSKIFYLLGIFTICIFGGVAPIFFNKLFGGTKVLGYSNCLGAGILIGASLIHLLTDSHELLKDKYDYPFSELFCGLGFFLAFILERVLFNSHDHSSLANVEDDVEQFKASLSNHSLKSSLENADDDSGTKELKVFKSPNPTTTKSSQNYTISTSISNGGGEFSLDENTLVGDEMSTTVTSGVMLNLDNNGQMIEFEDDSGTPSSSSIVGKTRIKKFPYMLFVVLAIESFISGAALGVQKDQGSIFVTFLAIITHIWAESFTLTAAVLKSRPTITSIYKTTLLFSLITPIGGVFGIIADTFMQNNQKISDLLSSVLLAFAAGCFLYVAIFEILVEEFQHNDDDHHHQHNFDSEDQGVGHHVLGYQHRKWYHVPTKWIKTFLLLSGFTFMSLLGNFV